MHSETENEIRAEGDELENDELIEGEEENVDPEQTVVMSEDTFSDPDISMEVNVEKLVAEFEKSNEDDVHRKAEIRRRLEELAEEGSFEDTYAIDLNEE